MFQRTLRQKTWQIGQNMVPILMTATLQNFLITLKVNALEKFSFSDTQNPKTVLVNTLTVNDKHYRPNRDNLTQPIQIQLSQKQRIFLNFFWYF